MKGGDIEGVGVTFELVDKAFDAFFLFKKASALFRAKFYTIIIRGIEHSAQAECEKWQRNTCHTGLRKRSTNPRTVGG